MGPDALDAPVDREREHDTFDVTHPTAVMIEQDHGVRQRADLEPSRQPCIQLADVDLVHGAAEDQVAHLGHRDEDRPLLEGAQRDNRSTE